MKKTVFILATVFAILIIPAGCSLTGDDAPAGGISAPRLLISSNQITTLSDPKANDWAPQIVTIVQPGTGITNRYLYFLSDRAYNGWVFFDYSWTGMSNYKPAGQHAIFRVQEVPGAGPGVYSNLQCFYIFPAQTNAVSMAIITNTYSYDIPFIYISLRSEGTAGSVLNVIDTSAYISQASGFASHVPTGKFNDGYTEYLFLAGKNYPNVYEYFDFETVETYPYNGSMGSPIGPDGPPSILSINQVSNPTNLGWNLLAGKTLYGAWPHVFIRPSDGKSCFGFFVSYGGFLTVLLYRQYPTFSDYMVSGGFDGLELFATSPGGLQTLAVIPILTVTHYPGTIDRDPSWDNRTGLYFSSDRHGMFNLYYVPKKYLSLQDNLILTNGTVGAEP